MSWNFSQLPASLATHEAVLETLSRNEDAEGLQVLGLWMRVLMTACTDAEPKTIAALAVMGSVRRSTAQRIVDLAADTGIARVDGDRVQWLHVEEAFLTMKQKTEKEAERKRKEREKAKTLNDSVESDAMSAGQKRTSDGQARTSRGQKRTSAHKNITDQIRSEDTRSEEEDPSLRSGSCAVRAEPHDGDDDDGLLPEPKTKREAERQAAAKRIFAFWKSELGHELAIRTREKIAKIEARLREYERGHDPENPETEPEFICKTAIVGIGRNPFNTGDNPRGKRYDSIGLIFRNNEKTDEYFTDGLEEMRRRKNAESAKVAEATSEHHAAPTTPGHRRDIPFAASHAPQDRREEAPRYVRSFECLESFYGAQAKAGGERLEALRAHVVAYPGDTEAQMVLVLAGAA